MNRAAPIWLVVLLAALAWLAGRWTFEGEGATSDPGTLRETAVAPGGDDSPLGELREEVAALRVQVGRLGASQGASGATLRGVRDTSTLPPSGGRHRPTAAARTEAVEAREAEARVRNARERRSRDAYEKSRIWHEAVQQIGDARLRADTLEEIRAAFDGSDAVTLLAALRTARWLGNTVYDRAGFRRAILPHATSEDPHIRRAAREALLTVQPEPSDLVFWLEEARSSERGNAETTAQALTKASDGVIRGEVADAMLHLLRDGTKIKRAFVMRGMQQATEFDPSVEARLIEIVRSVPASDYDSAYYFHFISARLDPKSDAVLDLMLDQVADSRGAPDTVLRGLRVGLTDAQKDLAADRLLRYASNASSAYALGAILGGLHHVTRTVHADRIEALAQLEGLDERTQKAIEQTAQSARRRQP